MIHTTHPAPTPYMTKVLTAAQEGNPEAQYCLGLHYSAGVEGFEQDGKLSIKWLTAAAQQGFPRAMHALGACYLSGKNCKADPQLAMHWMHAYVRSAAADDPLFANAAFYVGSSLVEGTDCERDPAAGLYWICKAAHQNHTDAQIALAFAYLEDGDFYNPQDAFRWFCIAAGSGQADAQRGLGLCYLLGEGVEQNLEEAARWFRLAAQQGDEKAALALHKYCGCSA